MKHVLVTGARGFVGRNLCAVLQLREDIDLYAYDLENSIADFEQALKQVDIIFHLAGVNRPENPDEFEKGNTGSLDEICSRLIDIQRAPKIVLSSSIQAELNNPYGISKYRAEEVLRRYAQDANAECVVFRFKNLFGKWCRPNYNSVTATFCHNIANDLPIRISDPSHEIELTHIDDVAEAFMNELAFGPPGFRMSPTLPSTRISLGRLAQKIKAFRQLRISLELPDFKDAFDRALYGTYLTYLDTGGFGYGLSIKSDPRGSLAEFLKSPATGQIFVSRTRPGITRGDHYHHTKSEKFLVLQGTAVIRFRHITDEKILEYRVRGEDYQVLDIPPGYTHSIENIGHDDLVTLFWASEPFDQAHPDTFFEPVLKG